MYLVSIEKSAYKKFREIIDSVNETERMFNKIREDLPLEYREFLDEIKEPIVNLDLRNAQIQVTRVKQKLPWYVRGFCWPSLRAPLFYTYLEFGSVLLFASLIVWRIVPTASS